MEEISLLVLYVAPSCTRQSPLDLNIDDDKKVMKITRLLEGARGRRQRRRMEERVEGKRG